MVRLLGRAAGAFGVSPARPNDLCRDQCSSDQQYEAGGVQCGGCAVGECVDDGAVLVGRGGERGGHRPCSRTARADVSREVVDEVRGEQRADDGDAEGAAEFAGGGLQPGAHAGLFAGQRRGDLGGQARQGEGKADTEHHEPDRIDRVSAGDAAAEPVEADGGGHERGRDGGGDADAGDQAGYVLAADQ